jgi:hypothetical protein
MSQVTCSSCGAKVTIPEGHSRAKIRCTSCGYYADVPAEMRSVVDKDSGSSPPQKSNPQLAKVKTTNAASSARKSQSATGSPLTPNPSPPRGEGNKSRKAKPNNNALDPRPNFESEEPVGPNLLDGDDIERDGLEASPYTVPGVGVKKCPECRGELPIDAALCVHCGIELGTKERKVKREYSPLFKEWEAYARLDTRLKVFIGLMVLNLFFGVLTILAGKSESIMAWLTAIALQAGLQAFLVGTFDKLTIKRNAKGKTEIIKLWRFFFFPTPPQKIDWKVSHGTAIVATHNPGPLEWGVMLYLLCCVAIVPGLLFYWFVIRPDRYDVVLCDLHGSTDQALFRTTTRDIADEICRTINETTGLTYRPVV